MQRNSIIVLFLTLLFFVSCSSSNSSNDSDMIPDGDSNSDDIETVDDDSDSQDADIIDDKDQSDDSDSDSEKSDSAECQPPLSEAPFPYYDANGKITFCRPNCDTPTADDPICISNLWDEQNEKLCHEYPEYSCCGFPCVMESFKPMTIEDLVAYDPTARDFISMHKCDLFINQINWGIDGSGGVVKSWNMSDGKIGLQIYPSLLSVEKWPIGDKYITYNIATQKYSFIIPSRHQEQSYFKGKRLGLISDKRSYDLNNENIFLAYIGDDAKVEIVYDRKVKSISYEPVLNEKWAFVNLVDFNGKRMLYAKVGEWKWTSLGNGLGWEPNIVGDTLALVDDNVNGWICDLSRYPESLSDCKKVNRDGEKVRGIRINKENEKQFIYNSNFTKLVYLELKGNEFLYKDLIIDFTNETNIHKYSLAALQFRGNTLLFEEITDLNGEGGV